MSQNYNNHIDINTEKLLNGFVEFLKLDKKHYANSKTFENVAKEFINYLGTTEVKPYDLENYLLKLVEEKIQVSKLKEIADILDRFYNYLGLEIPDDSSLTHSLILSEAKEGVVEIVNEVATENEFVRSTAVALILSVVGWLGYLSKTQLASLLLLALGGVATGTLMVKNPGLIADSASKAVDLTSSNVRKSVDTVIFSNNAELISNTSPSLDPRYGDLNQEFQYLSQKISEISNELTTINQTLNTESTTTNNNNTDSEDLGYDDPSGLTSRIEDLESLVVNGYDSNKFKIRNESEILNYNLNGLSINTNSNIIGDLNSSGDISVDGILQVKSSSDEPSSNPVAALYFNTDDNQLYVADGDSWNQLGNTYSVITGGALQIVNDQFGLISCADGQILKQSSGVFACSTDVGISATDFIGMSDVPLSFTGEGGNFVRVGVGESSLEFFNASAWDQDNSDELTSVSSFLGDVSGVSTNLQIGTSVVGSNELASSGVTAGTYGSGTTIPVLTIDEDGRITSVTSTVLNTSGVTSVGTITSGTWQGSLFQVPFGGTGVNTLATNGILYGNGTNPVQTVGVGTSGQVLTVDGNSQPIWVNASSVLNNDLWSISGNNSSSSNLLGTTNTAPLRIGTSNREVIRITADGLVGIGTTNPTEKLHIANGTLLIDTPSQPILVGNVTLPQQGFDVDVVGNLAYVADGSAGVRIYDVSGTMPVFVSGIGTTAAHRIKIVGDYAYVTDGATNSAGLKIFDISNQSSPTLVSSLFLTNAYSIDVVGKYAYVNGSTDGFRIIDISNASNPVVVGSAPGSSGGIKVVGKYAYHAGLNELSIIDISNPNNPVEIGSTAVNTPLDLDVSGRYVYLAGSSDGLLIYDVSDPSNPNLVSTYPGSANGVSDVEIAGKYAYLFSGTNFEIVDISDPSTPFIVSSVTVSSLLTPTGLDISGKYAYVVRSQDGFGIIDLQGANVSNLTVGNIETTEVNVRENLKVGNNVSIKTGLNIGSGGFLSRGVASIINTGVTVNTSIPTLNVLSGSSNGALINIQTTSTANYALNVQSAGSSRLFVSANGNVGIGVTNPTSFSLELSGDIGPVSSPTLSTINISTTEIPSFIVASFSRAALEIGLDGLPVIAGRSSTGNDLRVTKCLDASCITSSTTQISDTDNVGYYASMAIDSNGLPIITYQNLTDTDLVVTKCGDTTCTTGNSTTQFVDADDSGVLSSVVIGTDGLPIIAYRNVTDGDVMITKCGNASCTSGNSTTQLVNASSVGDDINMVIGLDGLPVLAYGDLTNTDLVVTKCGDSSCVNNNITTTFTDADTHADFSNIAILPDGRPIIAYYNSTDGDLMVSVCANTNCNTFASTTQYSGAGFNIGQDFLGLEIGTDGLPIMAVKTSHQDLYVIKCGNATCTSGSKSTRFTTTNNDGGYLSMAIAPDGLPVMAYRDNITTGMLVTKCGDETCSLTSGYSYSDGSNLGSLTKYFNNVYGVNFFAKEGMSVSNFDIAEDYEALDLTIESGDIVSFDPMYPEKIIKSKPSDGKLVLGVVSTKPGLRLTNFDSVNISNQRPVALAGRVPVKIHSDSDDIKPGDFIKVSPENGIGQKATESGYVIGKSLEKWDKGSNKKTVSVFIDFQYFDANLDLATNNLSEFKSINIGTSEFYDQDVAVPMVLKTEFRSLGSSTVDKLIVVNDTRTDAISTLGEYLSFQTGMLKVFKDGTLITDSNIIVEGSIKASVLEVDTDDLVKQTLGSANIKIGDSKIFIESTLVNKNSKIFLTPKNPNVKISVTNLIESTGFEVSTSKPELSIDFDWFIINAENTD